MVLYAIIQQNIHRIPDRKAKMMKKILALPAAAAIIFNLSGIYPSAGNNVSAAEITDDIFIYEPNDDGYTVTGCSGDEIPTEIPSEYNGVEITAIGSEAFSGCDITEISIPDTIVSIGKRAFLNCLSLEKVTIGSGTETIGDYAFSGCPSLEEFTVSDDNTSFSTIEGMLFNKDGSVLICSSGGSDVSIPDTTESIGKAAFFGKTEMTSVTIPDSVTSIDDYAFSGCLRLEEVTIPDSVLSLGEGSFINCISLKKAVLSENITEIPAECFSMCKSLESVNIGTSVTTINEQAFFSCENLTPLYIPSNVMYIGEDAIGTNYDIRKNQNIPVYGFCITGETCSAAEQYALEYEIDFLDKSAALYGDINKDSLIDNVDSTLLLTEYTRKSTGQESTFTYYQNAVADYNGDGVVDNVDSTAILIYYTMKATGQIE
jgi:hypothetical protein